MNSIQKKAERRAAEAIRSIAKTNGIPEAQVRLEMEQAIQAGRDNPDPRVQAYWASSPFQDRMPSPEEFILWVVQQIDQDDNIG